MKRVIYGMSISKKDLAAWIEDHTFPVMCAIAQLYLFKDVPTRNHWRVEVWEKLHEMKLLKQNNKLPSKEFIYNSSWRVDKDYVEDAVKWAISKEQDFKAPDVVCIHELSEIMEIYFQWLSDKLSKSRVIHIDEVRDQLDKLGLTE